MGTKGRAIVKMDVNKLVKLLNQALADEWLAYYQYWAGSKVAQGRMRGIVAKELAEHADEELAHANLLTERILQLGGTPLLSPDDIKRESNCGYDKPSDPDTKKLLAQNIKGEQCAISTYKRMMEITKDKDPVTYQLALTILQDEVEHEEDLQALDEDLQLLLAKAGR